MLKLARAGLVLASFPLAASSFAGFSGVGYTQVARFTRVGLALSGTSTLDGDSRTIPIGLLGYHWIVSGSAEGDAWGICAQFPQPVNPTYLGFSYGSTTADGSNLGHAGSIVATYLGGIQTSAQAAGLQLAVWEALYDGGASLDLAGGRFTTSSFGDPGTAGSAAYYASSYYGASSGTALYATFETGPTGQATLTSTAQPAVPSAPGPVAALPFARIALRRRKRS